MTCPLGPGRYPWETCREGVTCLGQSVNPLCQLQILLQSSWFSCPDGEFMAKAVKLQPQQIGSKLQRQHGEHLVFGVLL
jgi:hypothetical protein